MIRGIVREPELVQVQIPIPMIISEKGHAHSLWYSIDFLSGICLGVVHRVGGMKNANALVHVLNQAVREFGAPTRCDQVLKLSFDRGSAGSPDWHYFHPLRK